MAPPIRIKVNLKDKGAKNLRAFFGKGASVTVGVLADSSKGSATEGDGDVTVAVLAAWLEFGTEKMPARSWLRSYFDGNEARLVKALAKLCEPTILAAVKRGTPVTKAEQEATLGKLGAFMVGEIQKRIAAGEITPALSESEAGLRTIARKGSSITLIDKGQFRSAISYLVEVGKK